MKKCKNIFYAVLYLLIVVGSLMGCFALMTWGPGYTALAIVTLFGNLYCLDCCFVDDEEDKK